MSERTERVCVKIRGVYATALTRILVDGGCLVTDPSREICDRFPALPRGAEHDVLIQDRDDRQGIQLAGPPEHLWRVIRLLRDSLLDPVLVGFGASASRDGFCLACLELPGKAKERLDRIRSRVLPTLSGHHRFRALDSKSLQRLEAGLGNGSPSRESLEVEAYEAMILHPLSRARQVILEHVKPCGKPIPPRAGHLLSLGRDHFVMKRVFRCNGRYDGLDVPMESGDYGITEAHEGRGYVRHAYYSREGRLKGEYYNLNTAVELYPYGGRYVDLELDVVRRAGEKPFLTDEEKFSMLARDGIIGTALETEVKETARFLMETLSEDARE